MRVAGIGPTSLQNPVHRFDSGRRLFNRGAGSWLLKPDADYGASGLPSGLPADPGPDSLGRAPLHTALSSWASSSTRGRRRSSRRARRLGSSRRREGVGQEGHVPGAYSPHRGRASVARQRALRRCASDFLTLLHRDRRNHRAGRPLYVEDALVRPDRHSNEARP
jgi:hypothetical protein